MIRKFINKIGSLINHAKTKSMKLDIFIEENWVRHLSFLSKLIEKAHHKLLKTRWQKSSSRLVDLVTIRKLLFYLVLILITVRKHYWLNLFVPCWRRIYHTNNHRAIRSCLSDEDITHVFIHVFSPSEIGYCNSLIKCLPDNTINHLQKIQNTQIINHVILWNLILKW